MSKTLSEELRQLAVALRQDRILDCEVAMVERAAQALEIVPTASVGIKRVKVQEAFVDELRGGSAPVTVRIEEEADGDLTFVATRHACVVTPAAYATLLKDAADAIGYFVRTSDEPQMISDQYAALESRLRGFAQEVAP